MTKLTFITINKGKAKDMIHHHQAMPDIKCDVIDLLMAIGHIC